MMRMNLPAVKVVLPTLPTSASPISSKELLDAFLSGKSPKTIAAYRRDIEDFKEFLGARDMEDAARTFLSGPLHTANHIGLKYKTSLVEEKKLQPTTVNRKLAALRSLTDMAYTLGMINWKVRVKNQKIQGSLRDTSAQRRRYYRFRTKIPLPATESCFVTWR